MFTIDSRTEKFLESLGVKWRYTNDMTFGDLNDTWDTENLGRSQVKVQGAVQEYGSLMDNGSAAPSPILWRNPETERYDVLDGMQRLLAEELRKPVKFSAYIAETDSLAMVKKIRVFSNYRLQGGYQESSEWTLKQAVVLLINGNVMSIEEAAELGGWSPAAVRDKKQVVDFGDAVRGVGGPEKLPDSVLRVLAKHATRDDFASAPVSIAGFANDIQRIRFSASEAEPYIEQFFSVARTKGKLFDQFSVKLKEFRGDDEIVGRLADPNRRRYQPMTAEGRVLKALKGTLTTAKGVLDKQEPIYEMAEYFQVVNQIRTTLQQIERISKKR